jgi:ABC-type Mn2+/Zn2+ transport system permease subunit
MEVAKWLLTVVLASVMYGTISPLVYARRLQFLSAASSHTALLAVLISIPLSMYIPTYLTSMLVGLALMYAVGYAINRGVEPNTATSILVSFTASASVLAMYYVITNYELQTDIWALILGDPLLTTWKDLMFLGLVALLVILVASLTYREQFHIGFDRDCATLAGINVKLYDIAFYSILAISTVAMIKVVGFVLQHVLILLPCAIAMRFVRGSKLLIVSSVAISMLGSIIGLALAIELNLSPSGVIGLVMFSFYALRWLR